MGLIKTFLKFLADVFSQPPHQTPCTVDCGQEIMCMCETKSWPFPDGKKP